MIPKGTSHTSAPDSTYEVQKIKIESYKENISSIQNYQGLFLFLGSCEVQLSANHYYLSSGKVLNSNAGGQRSNPVCAIFLILTMTLLVPSGIILVQVTLDIHE
jgi:hypothetical protein